jgi:hypothetical protein
MMVFGQSCSLAGAGLAMIAMIFGYLLSGENP